MNNGLLIGKVTIELDSVDSTNKYAAQLLSSKTKPFEGTVIMAREQTDGRGQYGAKWESPANSNLYMSVLLYPRFLKATEQFLLNQAVSLGILDTIRSYGKKDFSIKWPNDVFCGDRKMGGVLIENGLLRDKLQWSIVGIGINLNQSSFPASLSRAVSLRQVLGTSVSVADFAVALCAGLERRYLQLRSGQYAKIRAAYLSGLYGMGVVKRYRVGLDEFSAKVSGISSEGRLQLESARGREEFTFKEVELLS